LQFALKRSACKFGAKESEAAKEIRTIKKKPSMLHGNRRYLEGISGIGWTPPIVSSRV
jgi:hypothetical protein